MGILRTDRVAGLGGANAITGSVNFTNDGATGTGDYLRVDRKDNSDFNLSTNDFTIEFWMYSRNVGASLHLVTFAASSVSASSDAGFYVRQYGGVVQGYCFEGNNSIGVVATGSLSIDKWYHIAYVRSGSTFTMYLDGTSTATASSAEAANFNAGWNLNIGSAYSDLYHYNGYLSNLRIINGTALYTSNFTPNTRLTNVANTVLLACQSCGNVLQEGTNKTIHLVQASSDNAGPVASRFTPNSPVGFSTTTDVGTQFGSTFDGVTTFDSQSYFVPPGGNTRERNRGRGVTSGGRNNHAMQFINIQSQGNSQTFGDSITGDGIEGFAVGSSTRGLFSGGYPSVGNVIEFITFATTSNGTDFGDMTTGRRSGAGAGNETRGLFAGGLNSGATSLNTIEFSTIATLGNSTDFGDLTQARDQFAGLADTTRGIFAGGVEQPGTQFNIIDFVTIATTGNAQDFGDMTGTNTGSSGSSDSTRGLIMVGYTSPAQVNTIDFVTIQSAGDAQDFGDLTLARYLSACMSNSTRAIFAGGGSPSASNTIDFVTIQTTGNANDFGDLIGGANFVNVGPSDSHGGLS